MATTPPQLRTIDVYWRPGCGFCAAMRTSLAAAGIDAHWHNIWEDADDATYVRSVADGNETVPTVRVGDQVLVAPRPRDVVSLVASAHPDLHVDQRRWPPLRIAQWVVIIALLVAANSLARAGQELTSWMVDGGAVAAWFGFRTLRTRPHRRRGTNSE